MRIEKFRTTIRTIDIKFKPLIASNDIDFISVENQNQDFPKHFHETFCISLIRKGIEKIELEDSFLYSQASSISITNPFEVHANPVLDADAKVSFDTIYLSNELVSHILNGKAIEFKNRQIQDPKITSAFIGLLQQLKVGNRPHSESSLAHFIHQLVPYSQNSTGGNPPAFQSDYLTELLFYIENHLENKLYLDELAKITHSNKFGFAKKFKSLTGMSPMSYVLMKKVFAAKAKINSDCIITDLAYDYHFSDAAHFSNSFKKYVGISPTAYKLQLREQLPRLYK